MTGDQTALDFDRPIEPICAPGEDRNRLTGQNRAVLERLRKGTVTASEIRDMGILNHTARFSDLRAAGFEVGKKHIKGGIYEYFLV